MALYFWVKAVNCANYIHNRMAHRSVLHFTQEEAWTHVNPNVSTFRIFGSATWALIPDEKWNTMEKKRQPLICIGYYEDMKAYMLFDPISKYVLFQRDVHFDERFNPTLSPPPSQIVTLTQIMLIVLFLSNKKIMNMLKMKICHQHQQNMSSMNGDNWRWPFVSERSLKDITMSQPI
jgi:hypothetical protein